MSCDYLLAHHGDEILTILQHDDPNKHFSINVNFIELFEADPSIGNGILTNPNDVLDECAASAITAQELTKSNAGDESLTVKRNLHVRIFSLPTCPELNRFTFPKNQDLDLFLQISGTVVRTTLVKMLEHRRSYMCTKCKRLSTTRADFIQNFVIFPPKHCDNPDGCRGKNFATVGHLETENCKDYQEIKLQEQVSKLGVGTIPQSMWVCLEDDLVETCKPGDSITVCGIVKRRWKPPVLGKKLDINVVLRANHVQVNNDTSLFAIVTPEIQHQFVSFWKRHKERPLYGRDLILKSFCPQIYGLSTVKLAVMVVLAGGSDFKTENDTNVKTRTDSHLLLVGDPGTGKSQLLRFASKLVPRSVLTTGVGSTSAGLTVTAIMENGEWQLEGGALVLCDGGVCCIDEFNSMKEHDRTSIHEAMEQQTISVAKAGIVCKLNTRCSILAATNPKGHLDSSQPLTMNIALPSPLLSRFDLVLILKDTIDAEWDNLVADYILSGHKTPGDESNPWSLETLQAYLATIKKLHPVLTDDANKILSSYYQLQRRGLFRNKARTTVRLLDSLVRLSQGHARLMFHPNVEVMDAVNAVVLVDASMQGEAAALSLGFNIHSTYPSDPMESYLQLARAVLGKLELFEIFEREVVYVKSVGGDDTSDARSQKFPNVVEAVKTEHRRSSDEDLRSKRVKKDLEDFEKMDVSNHEVEEIDVSQNTKNRRFVRKFSYSPKRKSILNRGNGSEEGEGSLAKTDQLSMFTDQDDDDLDLDI